ncbi:MAG TPA: outer membrane beta-barrel protein [Gammaproteobacteria bacterium]|nr:outer membrane beta-barrel protein [Gammaproteobacteria bacterium]
MKRLLAMVIFALPSPVVFAQAPVEAGAWYMGLQSGLGHINVGNDNADSFGFSWSLGYRFNSGLLAEAGASLQTSDDIFGNGDTYDLKREELLLGYQFRLGDTMRLIPKFGRVNWDLHSRDGALISASEDAQSQDLGKGTANIAELVLEFRINDTLQLGVAYEKLRYRFGESKTTDFSIRFEF